MGLRPRPRCGSLQCSRPLAGWGPTSKGRGGRLGGGKGRGKEGGSGGGRGLDGPTCPASKSPLKYALIPDDRHRPTAGDRAASYRG